MTTSIIQPLLNPIDLGDLKLANRVAMAPMTRARATNTEMIPEQIQAIYYGQRASAGLIITEGTWVNKQSVGYENVPGLFTAEQTNGWKAVTAAIHEKGGKVFAQLGHTGTFSHPDYLNGELPVAPSTVNPGLTVYSPGGPQPTVTPQALTLAQIKQTIADYKKAAQNAKEAGFDGLELHVQHPSIISQFLSDHLNRRTDEYGGTIENKARFLFEILDAVKEVWGANRVSIKIWPYLSYSPIPGQSEEALPAYSYLADRLNNYELAFLHVLDQVDPAAAATTEELEKRNVFAHFRAIYKGIIMASGSFNQEKGNKLIADGTVDLVSFGTLFIANPDLPERFRRHAPLNEGYPEFYMAGGNEKGYIDYAYLDN